MSEANTFEPGWFRGDSCRSLTAAYYRNLRSVSRANSSEAALAQCRDCGICFLTTIRNRGRTDMRCPTGCRKRHESKGSGKRTVDYRQTEKGRKKKEELNRRRSLKSAQEKRRQQIDGSTRPKKLSRLLRYYQWIILLLDGVLMGEARLTELIETTRAKVRQRGRDGDGGVHYIRDD